MLTFPCPWCDHEVAWTEPAPTECELRCDGCATVVDLAPEPAETRQRQLDAATGKSAVMLDA